jgi:hypothetical protein
LGSALLPQFADTRCKAAAERLLMAMDNRMPKDMGLCRSAFRAQFCQRDLGPE